MYLSDFYNWHFSFKKWRWTSTGKQNQRGNVHIWQYFFLHYLNEIKYTIWMIFEVNFLIKCISKIITVVPYKSRVLEHLVLKNQTRKINKTHKVFWIIWSIHAYFSCHHVRIFPNYILHARKINTFWSGIINSIRNIKSLCAKLFEIFSNIYFGTKSTKKSDKRYLNRIKSLEENASKRSYSTY